MVGKRNGRIISTDTTAGPFVNMQSWAGGWVKSGRKRKRSRMTVKSIRATVRRQSWWAAGVLGKHLQPSQANTHTDSADDRPLTLHPPTIAPPHFKRAYPIPFGAPKQYTLPTIGPSVLILKYESDTHAYTYMYKLFTYLLIFIYIYIYRNKGHPTTRVLNEHSVYYK